MELHSLTKPRSSASIISGAWVAVAVDIKTASAPLLRMQSSGSEKCFTVGGRFSFAHSAVPGFVSHAATSSIRGCWKAKMPARIAPKRPKPIKQILSRRSVAMMDFDPWSNTKEICDVTSRNISAKQRTFNERLSYNAYILQGYTLGGGLLVLGKPTACFCKCSQNGYVRSRSQEFHR